MANILPVITLYQPWATWIMRGWKTIETREHNRFSSLNGSRILIHSGQSTDSSSLTISNPYLTKDQILYNPDEVVNGFILGSVFISGFQRLDESHSAAALIDCGKTVRWGLFISQVTQFESPIQEKGSMGIWYYDMDNKKKVKISEINNRQQCSLPFV